MRPPPPPAVSSSGTTYAHRAEPPRAPPQRPEKEDDDAAKKSCRGGRTARCSLLLLRCCLQPLYPCTTPTSAGLTTLSCSIYPALVTTATVPGSFAASDGGTLNSAMCAFGSNFSPTGSNFTTPCLLNACGRRG